MACALDYVIMEAQSPRLEQYAHYVKSIWLTSRTFPFERWHFCTWFCPKQLENSNVCTASSWGMQGTSIHQKIAWNCWQHSKPLHLLLWILCVRDHLSGFDDIEMTRTDVTFQAILSGESPRSLSELLPCWQIATLAMERKAWNSLFCLCLLPVTEGLDHLLPMLVIKLHELALEVGRPHHKVQTPQPLDQTTLPESHKITWS